MKRFIDWTPTLVDHRPYDTLPNIQPVGGCHGCSGCFTNRDLTEYPCVSDRPPRRVCDECLEKDRKNGLFDAIMDIWDNYEEHKGLGHRKTTKEILEGMK